MTEIEREERERKKKKGKEREREREGESRKCICCVCIYRCVTYISGWSNIKWSKLFKSFMCSHLYRSKVIVRRDALLTSDI